MDGKIYEAITAVMADVGAVEKDGTNTFDRYKYRSIDAVMNAMHPAMARHSVFVTPEVLEQTREDRTSKKGDPMVYSITKVKYTFFTTDGSSVTATVIGEGMDRGDKSMNKAMSAAFKYALFQVFCIPTEEMVDSETDSPQPKADKQQAQKPQQNQKVEAAEAKAAVRKNYAALNETQQQATAAHYGFANIDNITDEQVSAYMADLQRKQSKQEAKNEQG